jgi:hypothetical protein
MMDAGRDRFRDAESHISPLAPRVALPDGYNARFMGTGKTTLLTALGKFIPADERI